MCHCVCLLDTKFCNCFPWIHFFTTKQIPWFQQQKCFAGTFHFECSLVFYLVCILFWVSCRHHYTEKIVPTEINEYHYTLNLTNQHAINKCFYPECKVWRNPLNLFRGAEYLRFTWKANKEPLTYYDMNLSAQDHQTFFTCDADAGKPEYESK